MARDLFSFHDYAVTLHQKSLVEILVDINSEVRRVESQLSETRGAPRRRREGGPAYLQKLKSLLNLLYTLRLPTCLTLADLKALRPTLLACVAQGELPATVLLDAGDL